MVADLLRRREKNFVLWRPAGVTPPPTLYIGAVGDPISSFRNVKLIQDSEFPELWAVPATKVGLKAGKVYYYWFKCLSSNVYEAEKSVQLFTDPFATSVDKSFPAPDSGAPAALISYNRGKLIPCDRLPDADGSTTLLPPSLPARSSLPGNASIVLYELPTRWVTAMPEEGLPVMGVGTFQDVLALLEPATAAPSFPAVNALTDRAHILELGATGLELLPPEDAYSEDGWGYGTMNYCSPDYSLGLPTGQACSTSIRDFTRVIADCKTNGIRFWADIVMAFCDHTAYSSINFLDFLIWYDSGDPEQGGRDGFGGDLIKYNYSVSGYDPISGQHSDNVYPSRAWMMLQIERGLRDFGLDGLRLDSVNNINNYDFVQELKDHARQVWTELGGDDAHFEVVGEELSVPFALLSQDRLDGLWNEKFKQMVKAAVVGQNWSGEPSFEWTVRKMIDCRNLSDQNGSFTDLTQAVLYITSHDVGGDPVNWRLYDYLDNCGIADKEPRIKLAFACLLTAVGIPMILAGEEFADQFDYPPTDNQKQKDPVNWTRFDDPWRQDLFNYVAILVKLRASHPALAVNDTDFIHVDFTEGKRVIAWQRGPTSNPVVVVANFSDWGTENPTDPSAEYQVSNWPGLPGGKSWREATQAREVPDGWAGREPIYPWEAKVYYIG